MQPRQPIEGSRPWGSQSLNPIEGGQTMKCYLEHANITVRDLDEAVRFTTTALPHFRVRGRGDGDGRPWLHVGDDDTYIAYSQATAAEDSGRTPYEQPGVNHVGFVVEDAETVAQSLRAAGYREGIVPEPHPHRRRVYFHDHDGNEWEFVEYFSDKAAERNDYTQ